jgi:phosphoribosyl 1,2-cyclic phosphate phosphodiesterase
MIREFTCTVLGSGTSAGVPAIGCNCAVCTSRDPRDNRLRTAGALKWTDAKGDPRVLLIDAGPDLRQQVLRAGVKRCDGVLVTHNHVDHVFGLDEVRRFNALQRERIGVWAEPRVQGDLRRVFQHIFSPESNVNPSFVAKLDLHNVTPGVSFTCHGLRVTPVRLLHGALEIVGYRFDSADGADVEGLPLAWCTDVSQMPVDSAELLGGLSVLVLDMLRVRPHETHLHLEAAQALAASIGADQTWFVHMGHEVPHEATSASLPANMALAWDGLVLPEGKVGPVE